MTTPNLFHVDVFANGPLSGNGLCVFLQTEAWPTPLMQKLTQEMKQFESIFLSEISTQGAAARVFTVQEELPFAGHPVLGAAAVLHRTQAPEASEYDCCLRLAVGEIAVHTRKVGAHIHAEMNQGVPMIGDTVVGERLAPIVQSLGLTADDRFPGADPQVISTGLPYLILPVRGEALARAHITDANLEAQLATVGARFVLVLNPEGREQRTWDNLGKVEDVATGSAAGPAAAYLYDHGFADAAQAIVLSQGRFAGRPSTLHVRRVSDGSLRVSGEVWPVMAGVLDPLVFHQAP